MYPSADDAYFGVFVKNFCDGIENSHQIEIVAKSVIKGQGKSFREKLQKYFLFYTSIIYNGFSKDFDIIYVHNVSHTILPLYIVLLRKIIKQFILILNPHGEDMIITHKLDGVLLNLSLPLIRSADQIVSPSHYFKQKIVDLHQINPKNIFVSASGGVNLEIFKPINPITPKASDAKKIGYVSRMEAEKGWDVLLHAVHQLIQNNEFKALEVFFIGKGDSTPDFQNLVDRLQLNNHIKYLGFKPQSELPEFLNTLDAFIFPTKMYESLGLVGLEAMACGIPVIGSNRGGLTDYIKDGYNGFLFKCDDPTDLSEKIITYYHLNTKDITEMKNNALRTAAEYSRKSISDGMIKNLEEMIKK